MKIRADQLLVQKGLAETREKAKALILAGEVFCRAGRVEKVSQTFSEDEPLEVKQQLPFVSRGGLKISHALDEFHIDVKDKICMDVGASTGGFTDCLLQRGAKKVYAVDVGYGQFDWKLRNDPRVVLFEKTNFRYLEASKIPDKISIAVIDVSFISLDKILPPLKNFLEKGAVVVPLVKPQFELSAQELKKGIVRSDELREKAVRKIEEESLRLGYEVLNRVESPIQGPKGNHEYLLYLRYK